MRIISLAVFFVLFSVLFISCNEKKKETKENAIEEIEMEKEKMMDLLKKREDSVRLVRADSIRRDSITKDSLRQVKEHGHVH